MLDDKGVLHGLQGTPRCLRGVVSRQPRNDAFYQHAQPFGLNARGRVDDVPRGPAQVVIFKHLAPRA